MLARQIAIGFGIACIFPLLIYYGVSTFHPAPKFETRITAVLASNSTAEERKDYAEKMRIERETYDAAARDFARVLIIVSTPFGIAAILIGAYLSLYSIGTGLIVGGIFSVAWSYWGYWRYLDDWMRFVSLLVGLVVLIFIGYQRTRSQGNTASAP